MKSLFLAPLTLLASCSASPTIHSLSAEGYSNEFIRLEDSPYVGINVHYQSTLPDGNHRNRLHKLVRENVELNMEEIGLQPNSWNREDGVTIFCELNVMIRDQAQVVHTIECRRQAYPIKFGGEGWVKALKMFIVSPARK